MKVDQVKGTVRLLALALLMLGPACGGGSEEKPPAEIARGSKSPYLLVREGIVLFDQKLFDQAVPLFQEAAAAKPDYAEAHFFAGRSLQNGYPTDPEGALPHFEAVLALRPDHLETHRSISAALTELGRYDEAMEHLQRLIEINPRDTDGLYSAGKLASRKGDFDQAISLLQRAADIDAESGRMHLELALALGRGGRHEEAVAEYEIVLELDEENVSALQGLGMSLRSLGREKEASEALARFREAQASKEDLENRAKQVRIWTGQAMLAYRDGRVEEAHQAEARLLAEFGKDVPALIQLGVMQTQESRIGEAIETYRRILEVQPENLAAHGQLIELYGRAEDPTRAAEHRRLFDEIRSRADGAGG